MPLIYGLYDVRVRTCDGEDGNDDIIDESLKYFKANVLFKNFEFKGTADRVLVYLTLYIQV